MDDKSLKRNRKLRNQENLVPFMNKTSSLYLTWSFNSGLCKEMHIPSKFICVHLLLHTLAITNQLKLVINQNG